MRFLLAFSFSICCISVFAQTIKVIDKSKKTALLFDESNPKSFVSILKKSQLILNRYGMQGMSSADLDRLTAVQRSNLTRYVGGQIDVPLLDEDPSSPSFGEPLIEMGADGELYFVYPSPDTVYIDLTDISRIIIDLHSVENEEGTVTEVVSNVTFCKIYAEEYVPVLSVPGDEILRLSGFTYFEELDEAQHAVLVSDQVGSYWSQLRDSVRNSEDRYFTDLIYMPQELSMFALDDFDTVPDVIRRTEFFGSERVYMNDVEDYLGQFPFDYLYGDSLYFEYYVDVLDYMQRRFDSVEYTIYQSDMPLIDADPDSPGFGDYLIYTAPDGKQSFVYDAPEIDFRWIDFSPKLYWLGTFNDRAFELNPNRLFFVELDGEEQHLVGIHRLNDYWSDLVVPTVLQFDWENWYEAYQNALDSGKMYSAYDKKQRSKLGISETYWSRYADWHAQN